MSSSLPVLSHVFRGTFVHAREWGCGVQVLLDRLVGVRADSGRIAFVADARDEAFSSPEALAKRFVLPSSGITVLRLTQLFVPGFIDTHCHAPQFQFAGTGTDRDLMVWLQTYTFPAERRMHDVELAKKVYGRLVHAGLAAGTTTAFYYGTIHLPATQALADACRAQGQRAFIGKVAMDQHSMDGYVETTEKSLADTEAFIHYCKGLSTAPEAPQQGEPLVHAVITPRFIPTCSPALLTGLGELAKKHDVWIQSHASESSDQVAFVRSLLPELGAAKANASDVERVGLQQGRCTGIFEHFGLLTDKCMMAHGTFLTPAEWNLFRHRGVSIAHCPLSNSFCSDRYLKVKPLVNNGNKVGLGSDVAGGYSLSILHNVRQAVITSKFHTNEIEAHPAETVHVGANGASHDPPAKEHATPIRALSPEALTAQELARAAKDNTMNSSTLSYADAFWVATAGGAEAIGMGDRLGRFDEGFIFDAQLIDVAPVCAHTGRRINTALHLFPTDSMADVFQKWVHLGDDRHVSRVYVQGRMVKGPGVVEPLAVTEEFELPAEMTRMQQMQQQAAPVQRSQQQQQQIGTEVAASASQ